MYALRTAARYVRSLCRISLMLVLCSPTAAAQRHTGVLTVAVYRDFAPFSQNGASDDPGVDVALAHALASHLGLTLRLLPFDAGENMEHDLRNMVWRGDVLHYGPADVMLHVPVDRRFLGANEQAVVFAPYYRESLVLVHDTRVLPVVRSGADLQDRIVAAEQGTAAASALLGAQGGALREQVKLTATPKAAMQLLLSGAAAGALVTRAQAEWGLRGTPDRARYRLSALNLNGVPPAGWAVGMAVKADNDELAEQLSAALEALVQNGELRAIFAAAGLTLGP